MNSTKILATVGPAIATKSRLRKLISLGVNAFRVNCSHGSTDDLTKAARLVREASANAKLAVGLLFDISGPKLRLDRFEGTIKLKKGESIRLTTGETRLEERVIGVNHPSIVQSVKKGHPVLIDDGAVYFDVVSTGSDEVELKARNAAELLPGKGINLPETTIGIPTITDKDKRDIETAVECGADFLAISFVRTPEDIFMARRLARKAGGAPKIIAKIEKREAVQRIGEIVAASDGVMIARGDLGVELPPAEVPRVQKKILAMASSLRKPVIVATQMLESMRTNPRATRAEINDVATAVYDLADTVMLSAETATGKYPEETVRTMAEVIRVAEEDGVRVPPKADHLDLTSSSTVAIAQAVSKANRSCEIDLIFAFTTSGFTAELISHLYPSQPIVALTSSEQVLRQLTLHRGVYAYQVEQADSVTEVRQIVDATCRKHRLARRNARVIVTGGIPFGQSTPTNFMYLHKVGK